MFLFSFGSRSFVPISSSKTSGQPSWGKSFQPSQRTHGERASTLPRTKTQTQRSSPTFSEKPCISIFAAPKPNSTLKPSDSLYLSTPHLSHFSPLQHQLQPMPRVSPTLTVPAPRLSSSPTSLGPVTGVDDQGSRQPSPVAQERRAKSITISNTYVEPKESFSHEAKHKILNQEVLPDRTHPELRRSSPMRDRVLQNQSNLESQKQGAVFQGFYMLQEKDGLSKRENSSKDKSRTLERDLQFSAIPKLKINSRNPQEFVPNGATGSPRFFSSGCDGSQSADGVHRQPQSVCDGGTNYTQDRHYNQTSHQQIYPERSTASPQAAGASCSATTIFSQINVSPNIETRRRRFDLRNDVEVDATLSSCFSLRRAKKENNKLTLTENSPPAVCRQTPTPQKHRLWLKAQSQAAERDVSRSGSSSRDHSCQSKDIDQKPVTSRHGFRTCFRDPHTGASVLGPVECTPSRKKNTVNPDIQRQKHLENWERTPALENENHNDLNFSLNQGDMFALPEDHSVLARLLGCPPEERVVSRSLSLSPNSSHTVSDSTQSRVYQKPEQTSTTPMANQRNCCVAKRAFIMEEAEDPYYVTMYYPGSEYVGEY